MLPDAVEEWFARNAGRALFSAARLQICGLLAEAAAGRRVWLGGGDAAAAAERGRRQAAGCRQKREELREKLVKKFAAQAPVYENCRMLSQVSPIPMS